MCSAACLFATGQSHAWQAIPVADLNLVPPPSAGRQHADGTFWAEQTPSRALLNHHSVGSADTNSRGPTGTQSAPVRRRRLLHRAMVQNSILSAPLSSGAAPPPHSIATVRPGSRTQTWPSRFASSFRRVNQETIFYSRATRYVSSALYTIFFPRLLAPRTGILARFRRGNSVRALRCGSDNWTLCGEVPDRIPLLVPLSAPPTDGRITVASRARTAL